MAENGHGDKSELVILGFGIWDDGGQQADSIQT